MVVNRRTEKEYKAITKTPQWNTKHNGIPRDRRKDESTKKETIETSPCSTKSLASAGLFVERWSFSLRASLKAQKVYSDRIYPV
jgi:hypothetical protein